MIKSILVLMSLVLSLSATFASATQANSEGYINQLMNSQEFSDLQAQSCMTKEGVRELLRAELADVAWGCRPEGARCSENSQCCNNRCTGIYCNDNAGNH